MPIRALVAVGRAQAPHGAENLREQKIVRERARAVVILFEKSEVQVTDAPRPLRVGLLEERPFGDAGGVGEVGAKRQVARFVADAAGQIHRRAEARRIGRVIDRGDECARGLRQRRAETHAVKAGEQKVPRLARGEARVELFRGD